MAAAGNSLGEPEPLCGWLPSNPFLALSKREFPWAALGEVSGSQSGHRSWPVKSLI